MAIESTAALVNSIVKMLDTVPSTGLTNEQIEKAFQSYQNVRYKRAMTITSISNEQTRADAYSTWFKKAMTMWVSPILERDIVGSKYKPALGYQYADSHIKISWPR